MNKSCALSVLITVGLLLISRVGIAAPRPSDDEAAIRAAAREWIVHFEAGDLDGLMALYMPDARVALHGQSMRVGKGAIAAGFAPALAAKPAVEFLLDIEEIQVSGGHAFLMSKYWYTSHGGGMPDLRDAGRSLLEYQRDTAGQWKILVDIDQATPDVAFPPPPTAR